MKDQVANFGRRGVKYVLVEAKDRQVVQGIVAGDYTNLYICHQKASCVTKTLETCSVRRCIIALAVDEAHCTAGDGERIWASSNHNTNISNDVWVCKPAPLCSIGNLFSAQIAPLRRHCKCY